MLTPCKAARWVVQLSLLVKQIHLAQPSCLPRGTKPQLRVLAMGRQESHITYLRKHPLVVTGGRTSPGAQVHLEDILTDPTLLVFWTGRMRDVHVGQKVVKPNCLNVVNRQVEHPDGSEKREALAWLSQIRMLSITGLVRCHSAWMWLDVWCSSDPGATRPGRFLVRL